MDDIETGRGMEDVDASLVICVFVSDGYFQSPNCMRELLRAHATAKPILALFETDSSKGLTLSVVKERIRVAVEEKLPEWKLDKEIVEWNRRVPSAEELTNALLLAYEPVEYSQFRAFRNESLRVLAEMAIEPPPNRPPKSPGGVLQLSRSTAVERQTSAERQTSTERQTAGERSGSYTSSRGMDSEDGKARFTTVMTYMDGAPSQEGIGRKLAPPREPRTHHVYCSPNNEGATELIEELSQSRGIPVKFTSERGDIPQCEHFLLYLNAATWTSGTETEAALEDEVRDCLQNKLAHLLLVHEKDDLGDALAADAGVTTMRRGVPFDTFFNKEQTPPRLVYEGVYTEAALSLLGGRYRAIGMAMLEQAVRKTADLAAAPASVSLPALREPTRLRRRSLANNIWPSMRLEVKRKGSGRLSTSAVGRQGRRGVLALVGVSDDLAEPSAMDTHLDEEISARFGMGRGSLRT